MVATYKEHSLSRTDVYYWYKQFSQGRESANPLPKPGRPLTNEKVEHIKEILAEFPYSSARFIATQVALSHPTVVHILKDVLRFKKRSSRWVPKILSEKNKQQRKELSIQMHNKLT